MERGVIDSQPPRHPRPEAFHQHIRAAREIEQALAIGVALEIEDCAALAPVPYPISGRRAERVAAGPLDPGDPRAMIGKHHGGHRPGDSPGQIEHLESVKYASHLLSPKAYKP